MKKYKKDRNSYFTRIYIGIDSNGKKQFKKLKAQTPEELEKKEKLFRKRLEEGERNFHAEDSLKRWAARYLHELQQECEFEETPESEYSMVEARLNYFLMYRNGLLARAPLSTILGNHIQPAINELYSKNPYTGKKSSRRTITRYLKTLSNIFEYARRQRAYIYTNPCEEVRIPKAAEEKARTALSKNMIVAILRTQHRGRLAMCLLLLAGLRRGEATALMWKDVDMKNKVIHITKSYDFKECRIKDPKTKAGVRDIPISDILYGILREACPEDAKKSDYVIQKDKGGIMTHTAWRRLLESYLVALKSEYIACGFDEEEFEEFTVHQLRHSYCSILQWSGVDIKTAQMLMGHSEYEVTANIYTHIDEYEKKAASKIQSNYIESLLA